MDDQLRSLTAELGGTPPPAFATLPPEAVALLAARVRAARSRQSELLDQAFDQTLSAMPLPLRGVVKKVLFS
ncbi:hypothetical protein [Nocardia stercoris]|uniref:Uncharacterized protein n=1 Tax=Nocardia stercoris TaxID=2483361 RepID=A0A3M2L8D9_9NOCA|nr:hypothetical protein [Nocardia stercoris]RMI32950.1 hypothetical protein EBN03_13670 [Nocardia stercoris]